MKIDASTFRRVALILAASAVIVAVAVYQGHAIVGRSQTGYSVESGPPILKPVDGSTFLRSYPVVFNGLKTTFAHYTSRLKADAVISEYRKSIGSPSADALCPNAKTPMLSSLGSGCSVLCYVTEDGTAMGVIAYDNAQSNGCDYFVGAMPAVAPESKQSGDCPGRDPPGVPKPSFSTRTLCIENLGGVRSIFNFYETSGLASEIARSVRGTMTGNGWAERPESSRLLTDHYEGHSLASFSHGREQCIVAVDQESKTGKIIVLVFWAERPWLPEGTAL